MTFEEILQRMLENAPDTLDKREGSIIYDAIAPCAVELTLMYQELQIIMDETFADTASRQYLNKRCAERGIVGKKATFSSVQGEFIPTTIDVIGKRFNCGELNFVATEKIRDGIHKLLCETEGEEGNISEGMLMPIEYIDGMESALITSLLIPGEDEESTELLRKRYFDSLDTQAFGGNAADYRQKTNAINGVGSCKVYPVWNGGGTVKLVILNSQYDVASDSLIEAVQQIIDPIGYSGEGVGIAPIGHVVTVCTAQDFVINVTSNVTYANDYTEETAKAAILAAIESYFVELREEWEKSSALIVRISQIEMRLLNLNEVLDLQDTRINGNALNASLQSNEVPIVGEFSGT